MAGAPRFLTVAARKNRQRSDDAALGRLAAECCRWSLAFLSHQVRLADARLWTASRPPFRKPWIRGMPTWARTWSPVAAPGTTSRPAFLRSLACAAHPDHVVGHLLAVLDSGRVCNRPPRAD